MTAMHAFWEIVVSNSVVVVVLAASVALLGRVWKNPAGLHLLWLFVLLKFVTPPVITLPVAWPAARAVPVSPEAGAIEHVTYQSRVENPEQRTSGPTVLVDEPAEQNPAVAEREHPTSSFAPLVAERRGVPWLTVVAWTWGAGIFLFAAGHTYRALRFRRLLRAACQPSASLLSMAQRVGRELGMSRLPDIAILPVRISPLVWSLGGRPLVVLPAALFERLGRDGQEAILAHELAHVRRKDHWVRLLELLVVTFFWWHPVAWWGSRQLRELEEQCCDAMVLGTLRRCGGAYASALLDTLDFFAESPVAPCHGATAVTPMISLERRIRMLKNHPDQVRLTLGRLVLLATLAAVPLALAFAVEPQKAGEGPGAGAQSPGGTSERPAGEFTNSLGMKFVPVPAGEFQMGTTEEEGKRFIEKDKLHWSMFENEKPAHQVRLTKDFYLGKYEVTVAQFRKFIEATGYETNAEEGYLALRVAVIEMVPKGTWRDPKFKQGDDHPVVCVTTSDALRFIEWLNKTDKKKPEGWEYRLPTEAEWEYAARGSKGLQYPWGNAWAENCVRPAPREMFFNLFKPEFIGLRTLPVGSFSPQGDSPFGVSDMSGNVSEWCEDWYDFCAKGAQTDPLGPVPATVTRNGLYASRWFPDESGELRRESGMDSRVIRGSSWLSAECFQRLTTRSSSPARSNVVCRFSSGTCSDYSGEAVGCSASRHTATRRNHLRPNQVVA